MSKPKYGVTRWCEWYELNSCLVAWGSADKDGVKSCHDGSARDNCPKTIRIPMENLDTKSIKRLEKLGDIEEKEDVKRVQV